MELYYFKKSTPVVIKYLLVTKYLLYLNGYLKIGEETYLFVFATKFAIKFVTCHI